MPARTRFAVMLLTMTTLLLPATSLLAQGGAPLQATIFFRNPPPGAIPTFGTSTPITIVVQVQNVSGGPLVTTERFSQTDFFRQLHFFLNTTGVGPAVVNTSGAAIHQDRQVGQCLSLSVGGVSVPQSPAIPVIPVETLAGSPTPFFLEYVIPDARAFYALEPGRYLVKAIIPFATFSSTDPNTLITNCETFGTPVLNVSGAGTSRQDFTIVSNGLEFRTCCFTFVGFEQPVGPESSCSATPCLTTNLGNTVPVKFSLFDASGLGVTDAVATISVTQVTGTPPAQPPGDLGQGSQPTNTFRVDSTGKYVFNLDTSVLARGIWRIAASISDGSVHTVEIQLR